MEISCEDNLQLLKRAQNNCIQLIYSDILFGTGRDFGDYQDLKQDINEIRSHYLPRFIEMKRVLLDSGLVYIHCGTHINHWIRCLLDEAFGVENFRNEIIWRYNSAPRKKSDFGNRHDIIYRYSKSSNYKFNPVYEPYSLTAPRGYEKEKYYNPNGKVIGDVWDIKILGQNDKTERCGYATQKPLELVERVILTSSDPGDLIADFYLGSGTTAVAAQKLNRSFIGCDLSEKAINITKERLKI